MTGTLKTLIQMTANSNVSRLDPDFRKSREKAFDAFTLIELLVTLAVLGLWVSLMVPALANTRPSGRTFQCFNNVRQLASAWKMYSDDNGGRLPPNGNGGTGSRGWVNGWLTWGLDSDNTNTLNFKNALLGPYTSGLPTTYLCPEATFLSDVQRAAGWKQRVRSTSMNGFIEGGLYRDPSGGSTWYPAFTRYDLQSDILRPAPSQLWVFADEHADSIDDGWLINDPAWTNFVSLPASYHNGACNFVFADNHAETHKWQEPSTIVPVLYGFIHPYPTYGQLRDVTWLLQRSTAHR